MCEPSAREKRNSPSAHPVNVARATRGTSLRCSVIARVVLTYYARSIPNQ